MKKEKKTNATKSSTAKRATGGRGRKKKVAAGGTATSNSEKEQSQQEKASRGVLFTGFPGFIGKRLIKKLVPIWSDAEWFLLVLPKMQKKAEAEIAEIESAVPEAKGKLHIITGDISKPGLGIEPEKAKEIKQKTSFAFHLAAIYHLAVPKDIAYKVNVEGTINVLDFLEECKNFKRFIYFSTCYVAGTRTGLIKEEELEMGQGFKNYYEETKFKAEVEVRKRMDKIPTVIIRPAIVIGDSKTGETDKYDGPYYLFKLFRRLPPFVPLPGIGKMTAYVNLVPIDYLVDGTVALAQHPKAVGKTFQMADPRPLTSGELYRLVAQKFGMKVLPFSVPDKPLIWLTKRFPEIAKITGLPNELLYYFNYDARFDTTNARTFLEPLNITCPYLPDYIDVIIDFFNAHPEIESPKPTGDN